MSRFAGAIKQKPKKYNNPFANINGFMKRIFVRGGLLRSFGWLALMGVREMASVRFIAE